MDPNIMKFLEEDEDETMHSGADVEAFTAELNKDIEGSASTSQQLPSDSDAAQSQFLSQWQTSNLDGISNFQSGQDLMSMEGNEQHSSQVDLQKHDSDSHNGKEDDNSSHEPNSLIHSMQASAGQPINNQGLDQEPISEKEPQMDKVQNISHHPSMPMGSNDQQSLSTAKGNQSTTMTMSNQQGTMNQNSMTNTNQQQGSSTSKLHKQVPFGLLLPIIQPQLDKDRAMQLHTLYFKLKKNEISKDGFVRHMRSIVGDQMLKMAVYKLQTQAARSPQTAPNQFQSQPQVQARQMQVYSNAQLPTDDNIAAKSRELESQEVSQGGLSHERKHPVFPKQVISKQHHMQVPQTSLPAYGNAGSSYSPFPATNTASSTLIRPQSHPNMAVNHLGPTPRPSNMTNMSKFDRSHPLSDPKKIPPGNLSQQQNLVSSMSHVKQEQPDQSNEQLKAQLTSSHGFSSFSSPTVKLGSTAPGNLKDESFEMQPGRPGFTPPTSLVPSIPVSNPVPSHMETNIMSRISLTSPIGSGVNPKTPPKKPLVGQKKPLEAPGSSPPSSKKQKVSGGFLDQSIEHLNDVTAVSGVNLREEEEQLFSGPKEDSRISEASRRVVQEEEEKLMLQKVPLQKKLIEIMAKSGLKNMSSDVEKCLSLCVEERMRGLISNIIRLSKRRVDIEKPRHKTIITSDVRQKITTINRNALEEWEKKQSESEKSQKLNEPENGTGVEGDKDDKSARSTKVNKEEDDKMRTTAANSAVRAAIGVGDMLSRWQLMAKQGGSDVPSVPLTGKESGKKHSTNSTRNKENRESENRDSSSVLNTPASVRKASRNQVVVPRVARSISVKDVIAVLEREPQMSKSPLIYSLYLKNNAVDASVE